MLFVTHYIYPPSPKLANALVDGFPINEIMQFFTYACEKNDILSKILRRFRLPFTSIIASHMISLISFTRFSRKNDVGQIFLPCF